MILTGLCRIGRDAELRYTPSGESVINLALAYNYGKKNDDGNRAVTWVDASLWGKRAESLAQYIKKGGLISVILSDLHIETYQSKNGDTVPKLVGRVIDLEFAGGNRQETGNSEKTTRPIPEKRSEIEDDFVDDIPF